MAQNPRTAIHSSTSDLMPEDHALLSRILEKLIEASDSVVYGHTDLDHYLHVDDIEIPLSATEYSALQEMLTS